MQGKNDRETCKYLEHRHHRSQLDVRFTGVTLTLNSPRTDGKPSKSALLVNIRDLDTQEQIQQVREYAAYAASMRSTHTKGKQREADSLGLVLPYIRR